MRAPILNASGICQDFAFALRTNLKLSCRWFNPISWHFGIKEQLPVPPPAFVFVFYSVIASVSVFVLRHFNVMLLSWHVYELQLLGFGPQSKKILFKKVPLSSRCHMYPFDTWLPQKTISILITWVCESRQKIFLSALWLGDCQSCELCG